jgi:hypothetical protein
LKPQHIYLALCVLGTVLPYGAFSPWLAANGFNLPLLVAQIAASPVAAFGWLDVLVSVMALFVLSLPIVAAVTFAISGCLSWEL